MKRRPFMLDTDTLSYLVSGRHPEVRKTALANEGNISISVITVAEALFGARKKNSRKLESIVKLFCEIFEVVSWTPEAASEYADIRVALESQGLPIGEMDMMIAASAKAGGYTLVTNNQSHFSRINGLTLANWVTTTKKHPSV